MMDVRIPDVGLHFTRNEEKVVSDEQAALILGDENRAGNKDFEEVASAPSSVASPQNVSSRLAGTSVSSSSTEAKPE